MKAVLRASGALIVVMAGATLLAQSILEPLGLQNRIRRFEHVPIWVTLRVPEGDQVC